MAVTYKVQRNTVENSKNRIVPKIHLVVVEKVWYDLTHSTGIMVASQVSAHLSWFQLG